MLFALLLSLNLTTPAVAKDSLFYQTEAAVRAYGAGQCQAAELGQRIKDVRHLCGSSVADWKRFSLSLIALPRELTGDSSQFGALREVVYRNTLITEAYAQLYLRSRDSVPACGHSFLPWVGGASLGSLKSGQVMRSGLSANRDGIPAFDEITDGNYRPRFRKLFGPLERFALESATLTLGEGNRAIFTDLYWQLLAGVTCGPEEVVRTIERTPGFEQDAKLTRSLEAWRLLVQLGESCDPATLITANKKFVEVEQYLVGQQAMYEGLTRAFGGWILSPMIEPAIPAVLGSFPTFTEHARRTTPEFRISFADADQRVAWMQDQLGVMEEGFAGKADLMQPLFCGAARDSAETRGLLKGLRE